MKKRSKILKNSRNKNSRSW